MILPRGNHGRKFALINIKKNYMDKVNFFPFKLMKPSIANEKNKVIVKQLTENIVVTRDEKNSRTFHYDQNAEELFSSFTANIIKEETLFTR